MSIIRNMPLTDRRKGVDRRVEDRRPVELDVYWEGLSGVSKGTINDISRAGCYILTSGEVENGDYIKINFPLATGSTVVLWGVVVNHAFEIGFGVKFFDLTPAQEDFLDKFVDVLSPD